MIKDGDHRHYDKLILHLLPHIQNFSYHVTENCIFFILCTGFKHQLVLSVVYIIIHVSAFRLENAKCAESENIQAIYLDCIMVD